MVTGCAGNYAANHHPANQHPVQQQARQTKVLPHVHKHAVPMPNLTQASSISTHPGKSVTIKQAPYDASYWWNWFYGYYAPGNQAVNPQNPQNPQYAQNPQPQNPQNTANPSQFAQQVVNLVNQQRKNAGLQPLTMNGSLSKVAMAKAQDMINNNYFSHQSPTYGSPFDMMRSFGITYSSAGENIAKGQTSPSEVMTQWMNSPGHRANILNSSYTQIGVAYYNGAWVQEFIG